MGSQREVKLPKSYLVSILSGHSSLFKLISRRFFLIDKAVLFVDKAKSYNGLILFLKIRGHPVLRQAECTHCIGIMSENFVIGKITCFFTF